MKLYKLPRVQIQVAIICLTASMFMTKAKRSEFGSIFIIKTHYKTQG